MPRTESHCLHWVGSSQSASIPHENINKYRRRSGLNDLRAQGKYQHAPPPTPQVKTSETDLP